MGYKNAGMGVMGEGNDDFYYKCFGTTWLLKLCKLKTLKKIERMSDDYIFLAGNVGFPELDPIFQWPYSLIIAS